MKRSGPLPKKRKTPRRTLSPRCTVRGCKQIARIDTYCRSHAQREADRLFSLYIRARDERCRAGEYQGRTHCSGNLQCAHVISRRYHAVRWNPDNAMTLCAAHHMFYTHRPLEWEDWCGHIGVRFRDLRYQALDDATPDLADVLADLRLKVAA